MLVQGFTYNQCEITQDYVILKKKVKTVLQKLYNAKEDLLETLIKHWVTCPTARLGKVFVSKG